MQILTFRMHIPMANTANMNLTEIVCMYISDYQFDKNNYILICTYIQSIYMYTVLVLSVLVYQKEWGLQEKYLSSRKGLQYAYLTRQKQIETYPVSKDGTLLFF